MTIGSWFSCKDNCIGADPTQDTVKVDMSALSVFDKENVQPTQFAKDAEEQAKCCKDEECCNVSPRAQAAQLCIERCAQAGLGEAAEEIEAREAEEMEAEDTDADQLAEEKRAKEKLAEEKLAEEVNARQAAEKKAHQEVEAAAEADVAAAAQLRAEQKQQAADKEEAAEKEAAQQESKLRLQLAAAQRTADAWCNKNGFKDMNTPKKTMMGAKKFPLHTAVKQQDCEMVRLLLKCGADQHVQDSRKQTPEEVAVAINKKGSHDNILAVLREATAVR